MNSEILDTNVLLRFLVGDNKPQQKQAEQWFKEAQSHQRKIIVPTLIVAETCFVLESFYKKTHEEIANVMEVFLSQRWLQVEEREVILKLWSNYIHGLHFVDSYLLAWAQINNGSVLTFDKEINK